MHKICPQCQKRFDLSKTSCPECGSSLSYEYTMTDKIVNCHFSYKCPLEWNKLQETENKDVRFCSSCDQNVYFAHSQTELENLASTGKCIAIRPDDKEFYDNPNNNSVTVLGIIEPPERFMPIMSPTPLSNSGSSSSNKTEAAKKPWWKFWK